MHDGQVVVPGGASASALWDAALQVKTVDADAFIRALFFEPEARPAYLFDVLDAASPESRAFALGTWIDDESLRTRRFQALLAAVIALNVWLYVQVPKGLFPQQDTGRLRGFVEADQAISFQAMKEKMDQFLTIVGADAAVATVTGFTGGSQRNYGSMFVTLKPIGERKESAEAVIGLAFALRYVFSIIYGQGPQQYEQYAAQSPTVALGPISLRPKDLVITAVAFVCLIAVGVFLQRSRLGTAIRAVSDNRDLSIASGIDDQRVILLVWVSAGAMAGLSGIMLASTDTASWNMGQRVRGFGPGQAEPGREKGQAALGS